MAIGFFFGIYLETVISGGSENVNAASFHHGPDLLLIRFVILKVARSFVFS
jgi:hypothetical protein